MKENNSLFIAGETLEIYRDGPKALIEMNVPPSAPGGKGTHNRSLYDLKARTNLSWDPTSPSFPCGRGNFSGDWGDPFAASAELTADIAKQNAKQVGTEIVNGIAAKVYEGGGGNPQTTMRAWVDTKYGLLVKLENGQHQTLLEVTQFSPGKPPASAFAPPASCPAIEVAPSKPTAKVTAVQLQKVPNYTGACPAKIRMTATITTDGPGRVWYQFGAGAFDPGETVTFTAAGTKTVTHVMTFKPAFGNDMGISAIAEAVVEDSLGNHTDTTTNSNNADFSVHCTSGGGQ